MDRSEVNNGQEVVIQSQTDVVSARRSGREMARKLSFGTADQTRLATEVYELARNALIYGGGDSSDELHIKVQVRIEDHGPGIQDIELAMTDGYSTGVSLGAGLPGARRLVRIRY